MRKQNEAIHTTCFANTRTNDEEGYVTPNLLGEYIDDQIMGLPPNKRPDQRPILKTETSGKFILAQHPDLVKREEDASSIIIAGFGYLRDKNYEDAIKSFDKVILLDPTNHLAYKFKGDVLVELKKYYDSIECYDKALEVKPDYLPALKSKASIFYKLGLGFMDLGKYDDAFVCFDKAIDLIPAYDEALKKRESVKKLKELAERTSNVTVQSKQHWWKELHIELIFQKMRQGDCIPFIGPGACKPFIPAPNVIANQWAQRYDYPLLDSDQLPRVAQFLSITRGGNMIPKNLLSNELRRIMPPDFHLEEYRNTPLAVLADLNLPIYITTNYDHFIEEALKTRGKQPVSDFCRWSEDLVDYANENQINSKLYDRGSDYKATPNNPLVYHLHGDIDHSSSMVLTKEDYDDFVIFLNKEEFSKIALPLAIRQPINSKELLFVGYDLNVFGFSQDFSVIFQTVVRSSKERVKRGISVQRMMPAGNVNLNEKNVREYLELYTDLYTNLDVYWGDPEKFSEELRSQLDIFEGPSI